MNSQAVLQAWQEVLPAGVYVSAGPLLENSMPLTPRERVSAGHVDIERKRELEHGRVYAKRALAMLGIHGVDLPIAPDRSPVWPEGIVGSITHVMGRVDGHFAAAVARAHDISAVGIDIERENGIHPRLWNYVLTERELERIVALPRHMRTTEAQISWCAKEAVTKAARTPIEPTEVDVQPRSSGDGFIAIWQPKRPDKRPTEIWHGRTARLQGLILAAVIKTARP